MQHAGARQAGCMSEPGGWDIGARRACGMKEPLFCQSSGVDERSVWVDETSVR